MEKQLWCVSIKHEDDESETIYHVRAVDKATAEDIATKDYVENSGFYEGDFELFASDLENSTVNQYSFEVREVDILE